MESPVSCLRPTGPASSPTVLSPSALWPVFRCLLSLRHPPSVPVQERARACDDLCSNPASPVCSPFHTVTLRSFSFVMCFSPASSLFFTVSFSFSLRVFSFSRSFPVAHPPHLSLCFPTSVSLSSHVFFTIKFRLPSVLLLLFPSQHLVISPPPWAFLFFPSLPTAHCPHCYRGSSQGQFPFVSIFPVFFLIKFPRHPLPHHFPCWVLGLPPPLPASPPSVPSLPCLSPAFSEPLSHFVPLTPPHSLTTSVPFTVASAQLPADFPDLFPPLLARRTSCAPRSFSYFSLKAPALSLSPCAPCLSSPQGLHPLMSPQKEPAPSALSCLFHDLSTRAHTGPWAREVGQRMKGQEERQSSLSLVTSPCAAPADWRVGPDPRQ